VKYLVFALGIAALPAMASEETEMPAFWYDLIAAENLASLMSNGCEELTFDRLVAYRLRNHATSELADYGIHLRTPTLPMSQTGIQLASIRVAEGVSLGDNLCEFARTHLAMKSEIGLRLKHAGE
jgi:hypothetical protein